MIDFFVKKLVAQGSCGEAQWPTVSVIIPCYNYGHFVAEAIQSVLDQEYPFIEVVVVDDGSTDNTKDVVASFSEDNIIYHYQQNRGLSSARNVGLKISSGELVQLLDADDLLGKGSVHSRVKVLMEDSSKNWVCCRTKKFGAARFGISWGWFLPDHSQVALAFFASNIAPPHAFLFRRKLVSGMLFCFDDSLKACEDYDFWLKLLITSGPPVLDNASNVYYRKHDASMSMNWKQQSYYDLELCARVAKKFELILCGSVDANLALLALASSSAKAYYKNRLCGGGQGTLKKIREVSAVIENLSFDVAKTSDSGLTLRDRVARILYYYELKIYLIKALSHGFDSQEAGLDVYINILARNKPQFLDYLIVFPGSVSYYRVLYRYIRYAYIIVIRLLKNR